jgi:hypothetical protein
MQQAIHVGIGLPGANIRVKEASTQKSLDSGRQSGHYSRHGSLLQTVENCVAQTGKLPHWPV